MNILNYCLRNRFDTLLFSSMKRQYTIFYRTSFIHNKCMLLSIDKSPVQLVSNRFFMKKTGLNPIYSTYNKKAAKDRISPTEYALIYNGTSEMYVRCLSGVVVAAMMIIPSIFIVTYIHTLFTKGLIDFKTYLDILFIPNSTTEILVILSALFLIKLASYSFISKYVLRIYKHNNKSQYVSVYINPFLPWKNVTCTFKKGVKLPDGKVFIVPWHKQYYRLAGYKSIILKERFRRPIDYDRMLGLNEEKYQ